MRRFTLIAVNPLTPAVGTTGAEAAKLKLSLDVYVRTLRAASPQGA